MTSLSLDQGIPPGVPVDSLELSVEESRSYPRWYTDLLLRKRTESVSVMDALTFIDNFGVTEADKKQILNMYPEGISSLDPGQFYVLLRLASHLLQGGGSVTQELVFSPAPIPQPKSILSTGKRKVHHKTKSNEVSKSPLKALGSHSTGSGVGNPFRKVSPATLGGSTKPAKMDIDSFTKFIMTGNMPSNPEVNGSGAGSGAGAGAGASYSEDSTPEPESPSLGGSHSKKKKVTFDSEPPQVAEAAARSMEELLRQRAIQQQMAAQFPSHYMQEDDAQEDSVSEDSYQSRNGNGNANEDEDEEEDVEMPSNVFRNVTIDSVLHNGVSEIASQGAHTSAPPTSLSSGIQLNSNSPSPSPPISQDAINFARRFAPLPSVDDTASTGSAVGIPGPPLPPKNSLGQFRPDSTGGSSSSLLFSNPSVPSISSFMPSHEVQGHAPNATTTATTTTPLLAPSASSMTPQPSGILPDASYGIPSVFYPGGIPPSAFSTTQNERSTSSLPNLTPYNPHFNNSHASTPSLSSSNSAPAPPVHPGPPHLAPPPPAPRRGLTSNYRSAASAGTPSQSYDNHPQIRYFSAEVPLRSRPIPPPPPPSRQRTASLQNPIGSTPSMLSDINSLQDEVERLRVGR